jgi:hypothetical protein
MSLSNFAAIKRNQFKLIAIFLCVMYSGLALSQDLQSWSVKIDDGAERFKVLANFNKEAVLDTETQLVWEKAPSQGKLKWKEALIHCQSATTGVRLGWRLPSIAEISSLLDTSVVGNGDVPALSINHPFLLKRAKVFWSVDKSDAEKAWSLSVGNGGMASLQDMKNKAIAWCVRSS